MKVEKHQLNHISDLKEAAAAVVAWYPDNKNNAAFFLEKVLNMIENPVYVQHLKEMLEILKQEASEK